ncbi:MAG: M56 family metallopeptidase, partial [Lachnospiraceae bacterium]|nr:M56 family metallopeptidase [Lachnospiraceae bacterium]
MLVLLVFAFRLFLKRYSRRAVCLLWIVVALRLIIPFSFESSFSIMPSGDFVSTAVPEEESRADTNVVLEDTSYIENNSNNVSASNTDKTQIESVVSDTNVITGVDNNALLIQSTSEYENRKINTNYNAAQNRYSSDDNRAYDIQTAPGFFVSERFWKLLTYVWLFGVTVILLYIIIGYVRIKKLTAESVPFSELGIDNVFICNRIDTAFIFGIINPRIYLPERLDRTQSENVVAHELVHIKRRDYLWKLIGFILLMVYWFNPLMWLAYMLFCRDIEFACDEQVISGMDTDQIKAYSDTLLLCSTDQNFSYGCPLAFGEVAVKDRIKAALSYKKPLFWVIVAVFILLVGMCVFFFIKPSGDKNITSQSEDNNTDYIAINNSIPYIPDIEGSENSRAEALIADYMADPDKIKNLTFDEIRAEYGDAGTYLYGSWADVIETQSGERLVIYYDDEGKIEEVKRET